MMTDQEMTDIIERIRQGDAFSIRNQDGAWGIQFRGGRFIMWTRYVYEDATETTISVEDIRGQLGDWDHQRVLSLLWSSSG